MNQPHASVFEGAGGDSALTGFLCAAVFAGGQTSRWPFAHLVAAFGLEKKDM